MYISIYMKQKMVSFCLHHCLKSDQINRNMSTQFPKLTPQTPLESSFIIRKVWKRFSAEELNPRTTFPGGIALLPH